MLPLTDPLRVYPGVQVPQPPQAFPFWVWRRRCVVLDATLKPTTVSAPADRCNYRRRDSARAWRDLGNPRRLSTADTTLNLTSTLPAFLEMLALRGWGLGRCSFQKPSNLLRPSCTPSPQVPRQTTFGVSILEDRRWNSPNRGFLRIQLPRYGRRLMGS